MKIWNARVGREFTLGGVRLEGAVDVLNLLNDDADQLFDSGGNQQYSPNFGKGRWRVQPRGVQISGRIVF
jgi:hypothetical protein